VANEPAADISSPEPVQAVPHAPSPVLVYEFGPFQIDVAGRHLVKDGAVVPLTAKVFDTLLVLVRHHDRPVMKEELIQAVWPGSFVSDDSLVQNISALRRALGDDASQPRYIATLARRGYRFIAPTTEHTEQGVIVLPPQAEVADIRHVGAPVAATPRVSNRVMAWAFAAFAAGIIVAALLVPMLARGRTEASVGTPVRFQEQLPPGQFLRGSAAVSPDGRQLAFSFQDTPGVQRIWVRAIDAPEAHAIAGTEGGMAPFWSPDGEFIGFAIKDEIKRVSLSTGSVLAIASPNRGVPVGASWMPSGDQILYGDLGKIFSVPATGGKPTILVDSVPADQRGELRWPQAIEDGKHYLFYAAGEIPERSGTYLGTFGSQEPAVQILPGFRAFYASPNYLLYVRDGTLISQHFNISTGQLEGQPMTIQAGLPSNATVAASRTGVLAISATRGNSQLVTFDRTGKRVGTGINLPKQFTDMSVSPDGKQVLTSVQDAGTWELWHVDLERQVVSKMIDEATFAAWAPDGDRFAYTKMTGNGADVYVRSMFGTTQDTPWLKTNELKSVSDWSPNGDYVVFAKWNSRDQTSQDLWLLPTNGDRKPVPIVQTRARESLGAVSPDGRWLAFVSDESGTNEVYVQSFPTPGPRIRISSGGGNQPAWRQDGHELFYVAENRTLMAVPITPGATFNPGSAQKLFALPIIPINRQYRVMPDGQHFLAFDADPQRQEARITVLTNWEAAQKP
jgi:DNA-binding winged helix-turn-helix (wHTH) protein/Tol biopolymer transport system component